MYICKKCNGEDFYIEKILSGSCLFYDNKSVDLPFSEDKIIYILCSTCGNKFFNKNGLIIKDALKLKIE